jgi:hypothetical protein
VEINNVRFATGIQLLFLQDCLPVLLYIHLRGHVCVYIKDNLFEIVERNGRECMPETVSQTSRKKELLDWHFSQEVIGKFTTLEDPHRIHCYFNFEMMMMMMMPNQVKIEKLNFFRICFV